MHILFLTDNFPPEVNAPASRTYEHCREWVKAGHQVTVITCAPNFPKGRVFDGYKNRIWQRQTIDGIEVIRVWTYITANEGFARRVIDYLSFMFAAILAGSFVRKVDIVVGTSPQFFTACAAYVVGSLKRRPWVFELRDLWPETIKAVGAMRNLFAIRMLERLELFLYHRASAIVSVTHSFKKVLVRRGIDPSKISVVTNGVDLSQFSPRPKDEQLIDRYSLRGKFIVGYIGTHGMCHALETIVEAADRLRDRDVVFISLGDGARKQFLRELAERKGLTNIVFIDSVGKADVPRFWSLLDASVIHLQRSELFTTVIPSKLFECMGMGIPVLHGVEGESADIVRGCSVGLTFTPEDVGELCEQILCLKEDSALLARFRENCLAAAHQFDRIFLANSMLSSLERVATRAARRATAAVPAAPAPERAASVDRPIQVLFLNQGFWPDIVSTAQHAHDLAKFLVSKGDRVSAVASRSMYGWSGAVLARHETADGIQIHRVGSNLFNKDGLAGRTVDFLAFNIACLVMAIRLPRHDVVVCLTTPPFIAMVGLVVRALKGSKFVFWTMDLYPDLPAQAGVVKRGSIAFWLLDRIDRFLLCRADAVVVLGRCMRDRMIAKGEPIRRLEMIHPWADADELLSKPVRIRDDSAPSGWRVANNPFRNEWGIGDRFVIEYSGNYAIGHDTDTVLAAMDRVRDDVFRWVFAGGGVMRPLVERFHLEQSIPNALFRPYEPRERIRDLLTLGDVHLVLMEPGYEGLILPSKFYGILAASRPTIFVGPRDCEVARVISESGCGFVIANGDVDGLVNAIRCLSVDPALAQEMGSRGRAALEKNYSMEVACAEWRSLLHELANRTSAAGSTVSLPGRS